MGCFLACFGTSKSDHKRRKYRNQVQPRDHRRNASFKALQSPGLLSQCESENPVSSIPEAREKSREQPNASPRKKSLQRNASFKALQSPGLLSQCESENLVSSIPEAREKSREQPNASPRKKVTFDSNVRTYEHVPTHEDSEILPEKEDVERNKDEGKDQEKSSLAKSSSEESSTTSSLGSYPPNHRYQNCRDSDDEDEDEELDFGDSDLDDEDEEEDDEDAGEIEYEDDIVGPERVSEEVGSHVSTTGFPASEAQPMGLNPNARDRSGYVHSVLNPVENLTQWNAVKAKSTSKLKPQKENFSSDQESRISFSSEPAFNELSLSFKSKTNLTTKPKQEMAVDASLSNWLVSPESTPVNKTSAFAFDAHSPDRTSQGSNSVRSQGDRPILGALTVDEIRKFSASSSPRKSPSRSPDEMPIIGTVGTYWSRKDSGSATSFKGIPNTTSKYREDKIVKWHSTPFETRLERALNRGETEG